MAVKAKKFQPDNGPQGLIPILESSTDGGGIAEGINPFTSDINEDAKGCKPFYSTGGRSLIRIGGKVLVIAKRIKWQISYAAEPIYTIDTVQPWDIDIGIMRMEAYLDQFIDPTAGPETDYLFANMAAAVHQPMVEMQILDAFGTSVMFARGLFHEIGGSVDNQNLSNWSAKFRGVAYQHYVQQNFKAYSAADTVASLAQSAISLASNLTGGI